MPQGQMRIHRMQGLHAMSSSMRQRLGQLLSSSSLADGERKTKSSGSLGKSVPLSAGVKADAESGKSCSSGSWLRSAGLTISAAKADMEMVDLLIDLDDGVAVQMRLDMNVDGVCETLKSHWQLARGNKGGCLPLGGGRSVPLITRDLAAWTLLKTPRSDFCFAKAAASKTLVLKGWLSLMSAATGNSLRCMIDHTVTLTANEDQAIFVKALSEDGSQVMELFVIIKTDSIFPYVEPSKSRRVEVWEEEGLLGLKLRKKTIQGVDLSSVPDHELTSFYQYYCLRSAEVLTATAATVGIVLIGAAISTIFFDPTGTAMAVVLGGALVKIGVGVLLHNRAVYQSQHIQVEAKRRDLQLVRDTDSSTWYLVKTAAMGAAEADLLDLLQQAAGMFS